MRLISSVRDGVMRDDVRKKKKERAGKAEEELPVSHAYVCQMNHSSRKRGVHTGTEGSMDNECERCLYHGASAVDYTCCAQD